MEPILFVHCESGIKDMTILKHCMTLKSCILPLCTCHSVQPWDTARGKSRKWTGFLFFDRAQDKRLLGNWLRQNMFDTVGMSDCAADRGTKQLIYNTKHARKHFTAALIKLLCTQCYLNVAACPWRRRCRSEFTWNVLGRVAGLFLLLCRLFKQG